jgi:hypothetical protein
MFGETTKNGFGNGWRKIALGVLAASVLATTQLFHCSISGYRSTQDEQTGKVPALDVGGISAPQAEPVAAAPAPQAEITPPATEAVVQPLVGKIVVEAETLAVPKGQKPAAGNEGPLEVVCPDAASAKAKFFFSPARPRPGKSLRVVAVAETALPAAGIEMVQSTGPMPLSNGADWGGPPYAWTVTVEDVPAGVHQFLLASGDPAQPFACAEVRVRAARAGEADPPIATGAWPVERAWSRELENLYSAWVARLFLVDAGAKAGWRPLHQVLRDSKRNLLWGYLGLGEDNVQSKTKVYLTPDCADTPFFLRAYFSWKMRLPFAMRRCLRGNAIDGPQCETELVTNLTPEWDEVNSVVDRFNRFVGQTVATTVHSGTVRTVPEDEASDLYPVALSQDGVRPGTVFVDPTGHVLVMTRWMAGTAERMGMLLAIDAHPDFSVSHKRFTPGNFYFAAHLRTGGFKTFRPAVLEHGAVRFMTNAELAANADYANLSVDQYRFAESSEFYRTVEKLLNPVPLDPVQAYRSRMEGLIELLDERVSAVQVAIDYMNASSWAKVDMPEGGAIFETSGPWEDYSTPARDLRLLLALDELLAFPRYVQDNPDLFRLPEGRTMAQVRADLDKEWERSKNELSITYRRSDRSEWKLTLGDIVDRAKQFEQSYNPNDCPEIRWGATAGTQEFSSCSHRASSDQRLRMDMYRTWHQERRRPAGY